MTFQRATDQLMQQGVTLAEMAEALGVVHGTVRQARLDPSSPSHRQPPAGWKEALAQLARDRSAGLAALAEKIAR